MEDHARNSLEFYGPRINFFPPKNVSLAGLVMQEFRYDQWWDSVHTGSIEPVPKKVIANWLLKSRKCSVCL